jgi:tetraacyldisaccharide 4'-kinase
MEWDRGARRIFLFPLTLISFFYLLLVRGRLLLYSIGFLKRRRLPCRVISIGNLTAGGTGKTPLVYAVAKLLSERGERVVVIGRGYRGKRSDGVTVVSEGGMPLVPWEEVGEEAYWLASRCRGIPILVGRDRLRVGEVALAEYRATVILLDDGFQHIRLERDLDLLLLDCTAPFGNGYLLPRGLLREPLSQIGRATAVVLTRVDQAVDLPGTLRGIRLWLDRKQLFHVVFRPVGFISLGDCRECGVEMVKSKRLLAVSGIGNPRSFHLHLQALDAGEVLEKIYPDHYHYGSRDMEEIMRVAAGVDYIVTTEKDGVKLTPLLKKGLNLWALRVEAQVREKKEWLAYLMGGV